METPVQQTFTTRRSTTTLALEVYSPNIVSFQTAFNGMSGDDAELELSHESIIERWGRLRRWVDEDREDLALLSEIRHAAELWDRRGRRDAEVWRAEALEEAVRLDPENTEKR